MSDNAIKLTGHPRAQRDIRRAKGWGGLVAFGATLYLSHSAGVPWSDAILRSVAVGFGGMLVAWAGAIAIWRQLAIAEIETIRLRAIAARQKATEQRGEAS